MGALRALCLVISACAAAGTSDWNAATRRCRAEANGWGYFPPSCRDPDVKMGDCESSSSGTTIVQLNKVNVLSLSMDDSAETVTFTLRMILRWWDGLADELLCVNGDISGLWKPSMYSELGEIPQSDSVIYEKHVYKDVGSGASKTNIEYFIIKKFVLSSNGEIFVSPSRTNVIDAWDFSWLPFDSRTVTMPIFFEIPYPGYVDVQGIGNWSLGQDANPGDGWKVKEHLKWKLSQARSDDDVIHLNMLIGTFGVERNWEVWWSAAMFPSIFFSALSYSSHCIPVHMSMPRVAISLLALVSCGAVYTKVNSYVSAQTWLSLMILGAQCCIVCMVFMHAWIFGLESNEEKEHAASYTRRSLAICLPALLVVVPTIITAAHVSGIFATALIMVVAVFQAVGGYLWMLRQAKPPVESSEVEVGLDDPGTDSRPDSASLALGVDSSKFDMNPLASVENGNRKDDSTTFTSDELSDNLSALDVWMNEHGEAAFGRFDLDDSGTINSVIELQQLSLYTWTKVSKLDNIRARLTPSQIQQEVEKANSTGDIQFNFEEFGAWLKEVVRSYNPVTVVL